MSEKKSVHVDHLREGAAALSKNGADPKGGKIGAGDLGSARADAAFEQFDSYWSAGRSAIVHTADALGTALVSAADTYSRRDGDDAKNFSGGPRAF